MQKVNLPNGKILNFPDEMSQADMSAAIQNNFPEYAKKPETPTPEEFFQSMPKQTQPDSSQEMSVARIPGSSTIGESKGAKGVVREALPFIRPTVEGLASAGGAIGGTTAGAVTGPFAPAVGAVTAAGAYTGAKQVLDRIEEWATLPPEIKKQPAMAQMKNTLNDFKTGLTFEFGGASAFKILSLAGQGVAGGYGKIKDIIRKQSPALTDEQVSKRAADIIKEQRGTVAQYDKNLEEANKIAEEIPGFKSTVGEKTGDPGLIKLQRGLEAKPGVAAELSEVNKAQNIEAIEGYLSGQFKGGQTVDDVMQELASQKASLTATRETAERTAKAVEEGIPTETPQVTGRKITESIEEARRPVKAVEKEYWDKVPDYVMTPTETERVFKELSSEPSIAQDAVKRHYELYKQRPKTIKGLQTAERELNDVIFDPNADATTKRLLGKVKTAINDDFKALGEAAEQGDFATYQGKVIHPKKLARELDEIDVKLESEGGMTEATPDIKKIYKELQDNKTMGIMKQVAESTSDYNKRIVADYKNVLGKEPPMIAGKEKPIAKMLKEKKTTIERQLAESEPAKNAAIAYANAKAFSKSQMQDRFKSGVIKELEMQGTYEGGKKLPTEARPKKLMDVESADKFINAVGKDVASDIMLRHYADDMLTKVKYDKNGLIEPASLTNWINRNSRVLDRYGIKKDFDTAEKAHKAMQEARLSEADFTKSIAAKMLNSDPQNAIAQAFTGGEGISAKNTGDIMRNLTKRVKNNPDAKKGLENAFNDFMYQQSKTTAETLKGDSQLSKATLDKSLRKFAPAMAVLYKGQPDKIKALQTVRNAVLIMNRTAKGVGKGPDTAEKMGINIISNIMGMTSRIPGVAYSVKLGKIGLGNIKNLNEQEVNDFVAKMLYDPDLAKIIEKASRKNPPVKTIETELKNYMERAAIQAAREAGDYNDNTNTK